MNISSGLRWGLVTFSLGLSSGTLGYYLPVELALPGVIFISILFSMLGGLAIGEKL